MAQADFKKEYLNRLQELYNWVRKTYPDCRYLSTHYGTYEGDEAMEEGLASYSVFLEIVDGEASFEDSDYQGTEDGGHIVSWQGYFRTEGK